ncbi:hypothetical protein F7731_23800 [Cytobacillus depressus]|uniref:Uncharacterized protein n=1 Tax=Cytobacillus depressus TaxID=1602942 RepID=A0A6L3V0J2_9BACI|nr:hypothetical protein [Cytobacillus depressus]KAB2328977.1 hypothetical protein F7731_23800 [Cytobacillus depressus]
MEKRRMRNKESYKFLCGLWKVDFENIESQVINYCVIRSSQEDMGLAKHEVKERLNEINKKIEKNYICGIIGFYNKDRGINIPPRSIEEITVNYVQKNIKAFG